MGFNEMCTYPVCKYIGLITGFVTLVISNVVYVLGRACLFVCWLVVWLVG